MDNNNEYKRRLDQILSDRKLKEDWQLSPGDRLFILFAERFDYILTDSEITELLTNKPTEDEKV